jgi:hypothetical protein
MKASNVINLVKLKLESKDQLLVRVWYSIKFILFQPIRSQLFMATLIGQSYWALVAQALLADFNCVKRCQGFVTVVEIGYDPMVSSRFGRGHGSPPRE